MGFISFDVDSIQEYVLSSYRPIDISGASELVKVVDEDGIVLRTLKETHPGVEVIYAGGGSGILKVPDDKCEVVAKKIKELYYKETLGSITVVHVSGERFSQDIFKKLHILVRKAKAERFLDVELKGTISGDPRNLCDACGKNEAKHRDRVGEEEENLCEYCRIKRKKGRELRDNKRSDGATVAYSFEELVNSGEKDSKWGKDRIGLIYGDLMNLGKRLEENAKSEEKIRSFSEKIKGTIKNMVAEIISDFGLAGRYVAPVVGGDDLVLIVPEEFVIPVVLKILKTNKESLMQEGTGFAVSFVTAHHKFPIYNIFQYAKEFLKQAKKKSEGHKGAVSFLHLTSGFVSAQYSDTPGEEKHYRGIQSSNKPYIQEDFEVLIQEVVELIERRTPSSLLHNLYNVINMQGKIPEEEVLLTTQYFLLREDKNLLPDRWAKARTAEEIKDILIPGGRNRLGDILEVYKILKPFYNEGNNSSHSFSFWQKFRNMLNVEEGGKNEK